MKHDELHITDLWPSLSAEEIEDACLFLQEPVEESATRHTFRPLLRVESAPKAVRLAN